MSRHIEVMEKSSGLYRHMLVDHRALGITPQSPLATMHLMQHEDDSAYTEDVGYLEDGDGSDSR